MFGKTIKGTYFRIAWSIAINKDGETEYSNVIFGNHKGKSWIEGDTVCSQYESLYDGLDYCSEVYKILEEENIKSGKYLMLNDFMLSPFSIKETVLKDSPRKEEVPATTINSNNVVIDLNGEWDTVYDLKEYGVYKDVVQITRTGNTFVGIKLIGTQFSPKGSETIKGDAEDNIIKSIFLKTTQGWMPAEWRVNEQGNEILLKVQMESIGLTIDTKLTRK